MRMEDYLERALDEADVKYKHLNDDIEGLKGWVDGIGDQYTYGNTKGAKETIDSIIKRLNIIKKKL